MPKRRRTRRIPRKVEGGIKARSESGEFAKNWWARRWIQAMENLVDANRLRRGRFYARRGQVLSIEEHRGVVVARVQGSRPKPYRVKIRVEPLTDRQWERVLEKLADQAFFAAKLLVGEMPANIEEVFAEARVSLFPTRAGDLITECSCPDGANPCKHVAATHYILGDRFDEDPFLLMRLRGRTQNQIMKGLRRYRSKNVADEIAVLEDGESVKEGEQPPEDEPELEDVYPPVEDMLGVFWRQVEPLNDFTVSITEPEIKLPVFRRLGEPDLNINGESLEDMLSNVYQSVSQAALIIAYHGSEDQLNGDEE